MLYLICPACHVTTYSVALWQTSASCPRCGRPRDSAESAPPERPDESAPAARPSQADPVVVPLDSHPRYRPMVKDIAVGDESCP